MNKKLYSIFLLAAVSIFSLPIHSTSRRRAQTPIRVSTHNTHNGSPQQNNPLLSSLFTHSLGEIRNHSQKTWKKYSRPLKSISLAAVAAGMYAIQKYYGARIHDCLNIKTPTGQGINNILGLTALGTGLYGIWSGFKAHFSSSSNGNNPSNKNEPLENNDTDPHENFSPNNWVKPLTDDLIEEQRQKQQAKETPEKTDRKSFSPLLRPESLSRETAADLPLSDEKSDKESNEDTSKLLNAEALKKTASKKHDVSPKIKKLQEELRNNTKEAASSDDDTAKHTSSKFGNATHASENK